MEDAIAGRCVVGPPHTVPVGEFLADRGLLVVRLAAIEDEVVVRDRDLPRTDRVAAGDLVERVDREGRRPVGRGEQIGIDADRGAGADVRVLVDAVRPEDLLGRGELPRRLRVGPTYLRRATNRVGELTPSDLDDPAGPSDVLFLR